MQTGTNLEQIKDYNQGVVLQIIRDRDGVSRVEIAQRTGLTPPTVSNIVTRLIALGLVVEGGKTKILVGKPRITVRTNPDGAYALGARIGRRETESVLVDFDGRVVARTVQPTAGGPAAVVAQIAQEVAGLVRESEIAPEKIVGLGVACPGPLDHATGWVHSPPNFPGWGDVPLSAMLEAATGYRVALDNNSRAAAVGERWAGAARGTDEFAMVYMGSGPSVSFVVRGEVFRGTSGRAGAFGHVTLHAAGADSCHCGGRGCVDLHCAPADAVAAVDTAIARGEASTLSSNEAFRPERREDRFDLIKQAALAGDTVATRELERTMRRFGHGVVMLLSIFDVGVVVLGGWGFRRVAGLYQDRIQAILRAHDRANVEVRISATDDPSAIGGAALALHAAFAPRLNGLAPAKRVDTLSTRQDRGLSEVPVTSG